MTHLISKHYKQPDSSSAMFLTGSVDLIVDFAHSNIPINGSINSAVSYYVKRPHLNLMII